MLLRQSNKLAFHKGGIHMKKKIVAALPFLIMPVLLPLYQILDSLILVEIFGCGCVPSTQANMLNIPINANDLRLVVLSVLTVGLTVWSGFHCKTFTGKCTRVLYCLATFLINAGLTLWAVKAFMWA